MNRYGKVGPKPKTKISRLIPSLAALAALLIAGSALAADKLKIERITWQKSPYARQYLSYIDSDGKVLTGRANTDFKLSLDAMEQPDRSLTAVTFDTTGETIHVVAVVQVSGAMQEVLEEIKRGVRSLADGLDPKTKPKMGVVAFSTEAKAISEMANPGDAESAAGTLAVDEGVEIHMLDAVRKAVDMLATAPKTDRKLVVLFSDGIDANMERKAFTAIGKRAQETGVVIDTIGFAPYEPGKLKNLSELSKQSNGTERQAKSASDVSAQFLSIVDEIRKQYVVTFLIPLKEDPKDHTFQVIVEASGRSAYSNVVVSPIPKHVIVPPSTTRWWLWISIGVGVLLIGLLIAWLIFREKEEEVDEEEEPEQAPLAAPVASAPQKQRTMALDLGSGGKMPAVGWIVAIGGKHNMTTFKFKGGGRTLIGTEAGADIVIDDQFMSAQHCEVRVENGNFKLIDLGSTNGILVNDKKVQSHELVDNDTFRLGRTEFKFKSIS